jgi:hypothetical protein
MQPTDFARQNQIDRITTRDPCDNGGPDAQLNV